MILLISRLLLCRVCIYSTYCSWRFAQFSSLLSTLSPFWPWHLYPEIFKYDATWSSSLEPCAKLTFFLYFFKLCLRH